MPPATDDAGGGGGDIVFRFSVRECVCTNVCLSVRMCVHTYVRAYVRDSVGLRLRHLYHVEFCSFIVRYPTAGASVYCGHIFSFILYLNFDISK